MLNRIKTQLYILLFALCFLVISKTCLSEEIIINKAKLDKKQYKYLVLDNQLRVIIVSDKDAQKSAAAMTVNVGSLQDPKNRKGIAHYLEHMLFLGTKKYPDPGEYFDYIKNHGGYSNAMTSNEYTEYLFDILPEFYDGALDRFSQFFIAPLFTEEFVDRERNAVDSEFKLNIKNDGWRNYHMFKQTSNKNHSFHQFSVGNLVTLENTKTNPIRPDLINFYNDYYSSSEMCLTLVANLPLNELEKLSIKFFSSIPKKDTKTVNITAKAISKDSLQQDLYVKALGETRELSILFPLESQLKDYKNKSAIFIAYLLGNTDKNSLYDILKRENLIVSLNSTASDFFKNQSYLDITFELTEKGEKNLDLITKYCIAYINYIKTQHKDNKLFRIYQDLQTAGNRNFEYNFKSSPLSIATSFPVKMLRYPIEDIIKQAHVFESYEHNKIGNILSKLTIDNSRRFYVSKNAQTNKKEKLYGIDYKVEKYSNNLLSINFNDLIDKKITFDLPEPNPYLAKNFDLITDLKYLDKQPAKLIEKSYYELWHKQDLRFGEPKTYINFALISNITSSSAKNRALLNIFQKDLELKLEELATKFDLAGISVDINKDMRGLIFSINSFSDKQGIILKSILGNITNLSISKPRLELLKKLVTQDLNSFKQELPYKKAYNTLHSLLLDNIWHPLVVKEYLDKISENDYDIFIADFLSNSKCKALVQGNIIDKHAIEITKPLYEFIEKNISLAKFSGVKDINIAKLKANNIIFNFNSEHTDNAVINYFQVNNNNTKSYAMTALTTDIISGPIFEQLRTNEQLGYVVFSSNNAFKNDTAIICAVESPKYSVSHINSRIQDFLNTYKDKFISMDRDKFDDFKSSLKANLIKKPNSLVQAATTNFSYILDDTYWFNHKNKLATELDKVSKEDLISFYDTVLTNPSTLTKLEVNAQNDYKSDFIIEWRNFKNQLMFKDL